MKFSANISTLFSDLTTLTEKYSHVVTNCSHIFDTIECQDPYQLTTDAWTSLFGELKKGNHKLPKWDLINSPPLFNLYKPGHIPSHEEYQEKVLVKVVDYAKLLSCKKVHLIMGDINNDVQNQDKLIDLVIFGSNFLKQHDLITVIEPLAIRDNYYLRSYQLACEIAQRNESHCKVLLDIYHLQKLSGNITETIEKVKPLVGHVQISQVPKRDCPFNLGEVNYEYVLKLLQLWYKDFVGLEYNNQTTESFDWVEKWKNAS